jgi:hypothetical protein
MELLNKLILFVLLASIVEYDVNAQDYRNEQSMYRTMNGTMKLVAKIDNEPVLMLTDQLIILLDYSTAEIRIKVDPLELVGIPENIRRQLDSVGLDQIVFEGKLGIDYIRTRQHPPMDFRVEGKLLPWDIQLFGRGHLEHIDEGSYYACLLNLSFDMQLTGSSGIEGLDDNLVIEIQQAILKPLNQ